MSVHYTPVAAVEPISEDDATAAHVLVLPLADNHGGNGSVGGNDNAYGMKINAVQTTDDIGEIMAEGLTDALRKAGLKATLHSEFKSGDTIPPDILSRYNYVISGEIQQFNVESNPGWWTVNINAKVTIHLSVNHGGTVVWLDPITGTSKEGDYNTLSSASMSEALDIAMQNCIRQTIQKLAASKLIQPIPPTKP